MEDVKQRKEEEKRRKTECRMRGCVRGLSKSPGNRKCSGIKQGSVNGRDRKRDLEEAQGIVTRNEAM
jgi:hypothetical protein